MAASTDLAGTLRQMLAALEAERQALAAMGLELPYACHILEVWNPKQAAAVLAADMFMNLALP